MAIQQCSFQGGGSDMLAICHRCLGLQSATHPWPCQGRMQHCEALLNKRFMGSQHTECLCASKLVHAALHLETCQATAGVQKCWLSIPSRNEAQVCCVKHTHLLCCFRGSRGSRIPLPCTPHQASDPTLPACHNHLTLHSETGTYCGQNKQ